MVPKHCHDLPDIQITDNMDKSTVLDQLKQTQQSGPQITDVVKYMRRVREVHNNTMNFIIGCMHVK